jgi:hypothetical protein
MIKKYFIIKNDKIRRKSSKIFMFRTSKAPLIHSYERISKTEAAMQKM